MVSGLIGGAVGGASVNIIIRAIDNYSKQFKKLDKSVQKQQTGFKKLTGFLKSSGIGYTILAGAAIGFAVSSVKAFMEAERSQTAFNAVLGDTAELMLTDLRKASRGLVADFKLMDSANKALALGIAKNKLPELLKVAAARGKVTGRTVTEAFEDISVGIGRQSRMILDNLGIILDLDVAYADYADQIGKTKDQLSEFEKKAAITNKVLTESVFITKLMEAQEETLAEQTQRLSAQFDNFLASAGEAFGGVLSAILGTKDAIDDFIEGEEVLSATSKRIIRTELLPQFKDLQTAAEDAAQAVKDIENAMDDLVTGPFIDLEEKELELAKIDALIAEEKETIVKFDGIIGEGAAARLSDLEASREITQAELDTLRARIDVAKEANDITKLFGDTTLKLTSSIIKEQEELNRQYGNATLEVNETSTALNQFEQNNKNVIENVTGTWERFQDLIERIGGAIGDFPGVSGIVSRGLRGVATPFVGSFANGGVVPQTGMALVHKGETVIPNGETGITFIVQGDLIGLDAEDISRSLAYELNTKVSL